MSSILQFRNDLWPIVHSYLGSVEDLFNLAITNKHFFDTQLKDNVSVLRKLSMRSFRVLLPVFALPCDEFVKALGETGAIISGICIKIYG